MNKTQQLAMSSAQSLASAAILATANKVQIDIVAEPTCLRYVIWALNSDGVIDSVRLQVSMTSLERLVNMASAFADNL